MRPIRGPIRVVLTGLLAVGAVVAVQEPASAAPVAGPWQCTTTAAGAALIAEPQQFATYVNAPSFFDVAGGQPVVNVGISAGSVAADSTRVLKPSSPPVPLAGIDVRLGATVEVYQSDTNAAVNLTGPITASGVPTSSSALVNVTQVAGAEWIGPATVPVTLPVAPSGKRQWIRVVRVVYTWSITGQTAEEGRTECRLVGSTTPPATGGTVVAPIVGEATSFPDASPLATASTTNQSAAFAARVILTGTTTPPPPVVDTCTGSGCTTGQEVSATVNPGSLRQQATGVAGNPGATAITLRTSGGATVLTVPLVPTPMTGALNTVTVTDERGGTAGWSLTATLLGDLTEGNGGTISQTAATLTGVTCTPTAGSATRITGTGGNLSGTVSLCRVDPGVDDSQGQSGGGEYDVNGTVTVTVPAFQKAGDYTGTIQVTLT